MSGLSCGRKRNLGSSLFDGRTCGGQFLNVSGEDLGRGNYCAGLGVGGGGGGGGGSHGNVSHTFPLPCGTSISGQHGMMPGTMPVHPFPSRGLMAGALPSHMARWQM